MRPITFTIHHAFVALLCGLIFLAVCTACSLPYVPASTLETGYESAFSHSSTLPHHPSAASGPAGLDAGQVQPMLRMAELHGASPPIPGNRATLLVDGRETFEAMISAIHGARDHVNFESYIIDDDQIGYVLADALIEKQKQGVQVNVIYDSVGSRNTPEAFFALLRAGGVNVLEFNPANPLKKNIEGQPVYQRDHRKILIVDGNVAFAGGINIGTAYYRDLNEHEAAEVWRDTHVRVEGPAAAEFQKLFLDTWAVQNGPPIRKGNYFPGISPAGNDIVQVTASKPGRNNHGTYVMYVSAIKHAKQSVHLTHAYFVPDRQIIDALRDAARRGVDVKIILPEFNDHAVVLHAGRSFYRELLEAGVRLYERCCANLHAKTAVIDGVWSTVGSTNMELWSLSISHEVNAVVVANGFGREMEAMFAADLKNSREITLDQWDKRSLSERLKQGLAGLVRRWL